ncbi:MAG: hypothetical protein KAU89_01360 [Candidatus Thorarchaeota archaeon]|jgi:hypothetical protein|nr:hypothetical protein [Candidatus Thorarchaeota archaeon]
MVLVNDFHNSARTIYGLIVDTAWLAGALAGTDQAGTRNGDWYWTRFLDEVREMASLAGGVRPTEPGAEPDDNGSVYDVIGGYISTAGRFTREGLRFRVPVSRQQKMMGLFGGILLREHDDMIVRGYDLSKFTGLVPIRGPLADRIDKTRSTEVMK